MQDPQTVSLLGQFNVDAFNGWCSFLDEMKEKEIETLKCCVSAWKMLGEKGQKEQKSPSIMMGRGEAPGQSGGADVSAPGTSQV